MPLQWRLQVLETGLTKRLGTEVRVVEADLYTLDGPVRERVIDALAVGADMPYVVVGDDVVHTGVLVIDEIVDAIAGRLTAMDRASRT